MQILCNSFFGGPKCAYVMRGIGVPTTQSVFPSINFYGMTIFSDLDRIVRREIILKVGCHQLDFSYFEK